MNTSTTNSTRLAKNTLLLYARTLIVMAIGLYTSRVILATLGVEDYGTYNVIGGFVSLFTIASGTLVGATQRFLNFEMGKEHDSNPNKVFCTSMVIHVMLGLFLLVLFETFGLWFLNAKLVIPEGRMVAANIVYQFSVLVFLVRIISMPYNAVIIANERMGAFAYISMLESTLHLLIALSLYYVGYDLLIVYSFFLLCSSVIIRIIYGIYCKKKFPEITKFSIVKDKSSYRQQLSFASYTFIGSTASVLSGQGVNVILNLFCGVTVNAARGIAVQVQTAVEKFVGDFMTALNPQIVKSYASENREKSMQLVYQGAKFSFYLMLILSLPIIFRAPQVLDIWLKEYPKYAIEFVRLSLVYTLLSVLSKPVVTEIHATGKIKVNAFVIGGLRLLILPLCYFALRLGCEPSVCYYITIGIDLLALNVRLYIVNSITGIPIINYYKNVIVFIFIVSLIAIPVSVFFNYTINNTLLGDALFVFTSVSCTAFICFMIGLKKTEKMLIVSFLTKFVNRKRNKNN